MSFLGGRGADFVSGGTGVDRVDYAGTSASVNIDLVTGEAGDRFALIDQVAGTSRGDDIRGDAKDNNLFGATTTSRPAGVTTPSMGARVTILARGCRERHA